MTDGVRRLYVLAGDPSGDQHAASLVQEFVARHPATVVIGRGGPALRRATGGATVDWVDDVTVVGLVEVASRAPPYMRLLRRVRREVEEFDPDLVLLVDFSGFNHALASRLRRRGCRGSVVQYVGPQVWASRPGRVRRMARDLDAVLCLFPFEPRCYEGSGLPATFVGHPLTDSLRPRRQARDAQLFALLPGSREGEVRRMLPPMVAAASAVGRDRPGARFVVPAVSPRLRALIAEIEPDAVAEGWLETQDRGAAELMSRAWAGLVTSGTATLEAALVGMPHVITYKTRRTTEWLARRLLMVPWIGLPNLLLQREAVPELLGREATADSLAAALWRIARDGPARDQQLSDLAEVRAALGEGGSTRRACDELDRFLPG